MCLPKSEILIARSGLGKCADRNPHLLVCAIVLLSGQGDKWISSFLPPLILVIVCRCVKQTLFRYFCTTFVTWDFGSGSPGFPPTFVILAVSIGSAPIWIRRYVAFPLSVNVNAEQNNWMTSLHTCLLVLLCGYSWAANAGFICPD